MKVIRKLRNAIIRKLGGITFDDAARDVGVIKDYWKHVPIYTSIYVNSDMCTEEYTKSIEREIARRLSEYMLDAGHISFMSHRVNHGDVKVTGQAHILDLKERTSCHMPTHLKFDNAT